MKTVQEPSNFYWIYIENHPKFTGCVVDARGNRAYFLNGKRHREDGPAVEWPNGYKVYWLYGEEYSYEEWKKEVTKLNRNCKANNDIKTITQFQTTDKQIFNTLEDAQNHEANMVQTKETP